MQPAAWHDKTIYGLHIRVPVPFFAYQEIDDVNHKLTSYLHPFQVFNPLPITTTLLLWSVSHLSIYTLAVAVRFALGQKCACNSQTAEAKLLISRWKVGCIICSIDNNHDLVKKIANAMQNTSLTHFEQYVLYLILSYRFTCFFLYFDAFFFWSSFKWQRF